MKIKSLHLKNFRCFDDFNIEFENQMTVIVAENGKGKTAILDAVAIAVGPYITCFNGGKNRSLEDDDVRQSQEAAAGGQMRILRMKSYYPIELEVVGQLGEKTCTWQRELQAQGGRTTVRRAKCLTDYGQGLKKMINSDHDMECVLPVIAYYGTTRMWQDSKLLTNNKDKINLERDSGYAECLEPSSSYNTFGQWFKYASLSTLEYDRYLEETGSTEPNPYREVLKAVSQSIETCVGSMGWKNIDYSVASQSLVISKEHVGTLPLKALSDGVRSVISMAADIAYRMARLNPDLGAEVTQKTPGIVLIDEVEMHLHPSWQQVVLADLQKAFPLVQFVVTTHSPQVLTSVDSNSIRVLRWAESKIDIYCPEFSLGAESYQLLKDIQNVDTRPQALPIVQDLSRYLALVSEDKWDSEEAVLLRKRLDAWARGREPALLRADLDIRMRAFHRHKQ
ncbi:MAG: AAA family ATPase [Acidaminococcaceae bacterium]